MIFTPSSAGVFRPRIFTARPVRITPNASGSFTVDLAATTLLRPDVWYELTIRWLDPLAGYTSTDFPGWKIRVPEEGGNIADLVDANPTSYSSYIGADDPAKFVQPGEATWWIDTSSNPPLLKEWSS
jgi:hypothetical protein